MITNDMSFLIGGDAGQGVESSGAGFAKAFARGGLHIFGLQDYHSRIRGGHNFFQIRVHEHPLYSHTEDIHVVLALTAETVRIHLDSVAPGGGIIYDADDEIDTAAMEKADVKPFPVPLSKMAQDHGGSKVMRNTAALGAAAGVVGYDFIRIDDVIRTNFQKKGDQVVEGNLKVAEAAYHFTREQYASDFAYRVTSVEGPRRMVINGNQAFAFGAAVSGCNFVSGYPMTPATSVLQWLTAHAKEFGIVTKHTEDEIAAICMAVGAGHMGARALAPTSGGGFALMSEALGLAGMTETPVVLFVAQRTGPSTGFATRTEQGDLLFVLHASQSEFPRILLAPHTVEECFHAGARAFNLAERYQCPVIVLSDATLANSLRTVDLKVFDLGQVEIDRGALLTDEDLDGLTEAYKRYAFTESGISQRAMPGHPKAVYATTSDEHDELGHITEDAENRIRMMDKRMRKLETALGDMEPPETYGPENAETTLVTWGSSYGPLREAVDRLNKNGDKVNLLCLIDIWPFAREPVVEVLERARRLVDVEGNFSGQMADLIRTRTGVEISERILKYDGRPFSPEYIINQLNEGG